MNFFGPSAPVVKSVVRRVTVQVPAKGAGQSASPSKSVSKTTTKSVSHSASSAGTSTPSPPSTKRPETRASKRPDPRAAKRPNNKTDPQSQHQSERSPRTTTELFAKWDSRSPALGSWARGLFVAQNKRYMGMGARITSTDLDMHQVERGGIPESVRDAPTRRPIERTVRPWRNDFY